MKTSNLTFEDGFLGTQAADARAKGNEMMVFDWDKAASIIKDRLKAHPDLIAEAGLEGDWDYTGGQIFAEGKPDLEPYTYLSSNWATPTLIISWDGGEEEIECYTTEESRFAEDSKWDETSLSILNQ